MLNNLIVLSALLVGFAGCVVTVYFFAAYVFSGFGKYPPFFCSFGRSKKTVIQEAEKILEKEDKPVKVVDLGGGDGCLLIPLAKKFPQHSFIYYDLDKVPYFIAKFRTRKLKNITLFNRNFMKETYNDVRLVLCYTSSALKDELGKKLLSELPEGSFVIAETFDLDHLPLVKTIQADTFKIPTKVFIYQK